VDTLGRVEMFDLARKRPGVKDEMMKDHEKTIGNLQILGFVEIPYIPF
jgi:hypothetical protein